MRWLCTPRPPRAAPHPMCESVGTCRSRPPVPAARLERWGDETGRAAASVIADTKRRAVRRRARGGCLRNREIRGRRANMQGSLQPSQGREVQGNPNRCQIDLIFRKIKLNRKIFDRTGQIFKFKFKFESGSENLASDNLGRSRALASTHFGVAQPFLACALGLPTTLARSMLYLPLRQRTRRPQHFAGQSVPRALGRGVRMSCARISTALSSLLLLALAGGRSEAGLPRRITSSCLPAQHGESLAVIKALRGGGRGRRKDWQSPRRGDSDYQESGSSVSEWGDHAAAREEDSDEDFRVPESSEDEQGGGSDSESYSYVTPQRHSREPPRHGQRAGATRQGPQRIRRPPPRSPSPPPPRPRAARGRGRGRGKVISAAARWGTRADDALDAAMRGEVRAVPASPFAARSLCLSRAADPIQLPEYYQRIHQLKALPGRGHACLASEWCPGH